MPGMSDESKESVFARWSAIVIAVVAILVAISWSCTSKIRHRVFWQQKRADQTVDITILYVYTV